MAHLSCNKTTVTVDLCFGRHEVLLNSKLNHIDLRFTFVNMRFTIVHLNIGQSLYDPEFKLVTKVTTEIKFF